MRPRRLLAVPVVAVLAWCLPMGVSWAELPDGEVHVAVSVDPLASRAAPSVVFVARVWTSGDDGAGPTRVTSLSLRLERGVGRQWRPIRARRRVSRAPISDGRLIRLRVSRTGIERAIRAGARLRTVLAYRLRAGRQTAAGRRVAQFDLGSILATAPALNPHPGLPEAVRFDAVLDARTLRVTDVKDRSRRHVVRLLGLDTPNVDRAGAATECFGPEAVGFLASPFTQGQILDLAYDGRAPGRDPDGRLQAYLDSSDMHAALVRGGFARLTADAQRLSRYRELRSAEAFARSHRRGLWSTCGGEPHRPLTFLQSAASTTPPPDVRTLSAGVSAPPTCRPQGCPFILYVTAIPERTGDVVDPMRLRRDALIRAFTIHLAAPTPQELSLKDDVLGFPSTARLQILRRNRDQRRAVAQTELANLAPHLGSTIRFELPRPLAAKNGDWVAISTPTWAPILNADRPPTDALLLSPPDTDCAPGFHTLLGPGAQSPFTCLSSGAQLAYDIELTDL